MSDGKVIYEVRADDSKIGSDLDSANSKVSKGANKLTGTMQAAALGMGAAVVAGTAAAVKFGSEFETSMAAASTLFGDVAVDVDNLQNKILDLSDASGVSGDELNKALYSALSAGIPVTEDMAEATEFLESATRLAKAGFTDVDTAISATAKTLNAYGLEASEADRIQKILMQTQNKGITTVGELGSVLSNVTPTAATMGVEFEQIGAAIAGMTAQGTPAAQSTTQLNSLFAELGKQGTQAQKALAKATEGTKYAGKSFQELNKEGVPLNEILDLMGIYAAENGVGMLDMFSSIEAGKAALALSGENAKTFTDNLAAMSTETDVVGEAFEKVSGTSAERFAKIMNQLQNVAIELFIALAPLIESVLPILADLFSQLAPPIAQLIEGLLPPLVEIINLLLPPILELINVLLPVLIDLFNALMPPILQLINTVILPLINVILDLIKLAIKPLATAFEITANHIISNLQTVGNFIVGIIEAWKKIFGGFMDFIKGVFTGDWEKAWEGITKIFSGITDGWKEIIKLPLNFIIDKINSFLGGLSNIKIPDWIPGIGGKEFKFTAIPKLAKGGLAFGETTAIVGDNPNASNDPEVIAPLSKLENMLNLKGASNKQNNISVVVSGNNIASDYDVNRVGTILTNKLLNEGVL